MDSGSGSVNISMVQTQFRPSEKYGSKLFQKPDLTKMPGSRFGSKAKM